jgi:rod shape-determining protein MreC
VRDSRRARLVLAMLLLTAFTLITLDFRSGGGGPLRKIGNAVFGPVERAVGAVTHPIGSFFSGLGHLSSYKSENQRLHAQNQQLLQRLRSADANDNKLTDAEKLLGLAGRAHFRIVGAQVVALGSSLGFEWTATIDVGSSDGIQRNETVIDGDGLVGKTLDVGPTTTTVLLGNDPKFTAGARLESSQEVGHVDGGGRGPMTFTLLSSQATMSVGDRLVTFPSIRNRPFPAEVPIGHITRIEPTPGQLYRTAVVTPYADFTSLDVVGVVVAVPRTIPRNSLLPPSPTPSPQPSTPAPTSPSPSTPARGTTTPSPGTRVSPSPSRSG